jgi:hypothetical protein
MDMYKISKLELDAIADRMRLITAAFNGEYPPEMAMEWTKDILDWVADVFNDTLARKDYNAINEPTELS